MSSALLDQVQARIRGTFTKTEVVTVQPYGGEFSTAEMKQVSYNCPAIFVTVLGWEPLRDGHRLAGKYSRNVRVAAFVAAKHAKRETRMRLAMDLADKLCLVMRQWMPVNPAEQPVTIGPLESDASSENLYSRAVDELGQSVWLVDWFQPVKPVMGQGTAAPTLIDWLGVDIENTVRSTEPAPTAPTDPGPFGVTDKIIF
ncbi:MAG: hypothetical protein A2Z93_06165 [Curvibacter sp. GWA2_64_110]|nr:MAG: hypothetical protein A2Z93_06165 [Curvibacter sp. GWA2_64_110]HCY15616.1 hypothetical protein [Curvibacter sp.]